MDGDGNNPRAVLVMMIALIVMFNTLRPILKPPTHILDAINPKPEMTDAEFLLKQVAAKSFRLFTNLAFAFAFAAALVQVWKHAAYGSSDVADQTWRCERVSLVLVMVALLCMSLSAKCAMVIVLSPSSFLSAFSFVEGLLLLVALSLFSGVFMAATVG